MQYLILWIGLPILAACILWPGIVFWAAISVFGLNLLVILSGWRLGWFPNTGIRSKATTQVVTKCTL